jgi:hypothetical protein
MTRDRRLGWLAVLAGGALALAVQIAAPVGVPLYDGVVVQEPYRYLHPTGDQAGSPTSFSATVPVAGPESPTIVAATTENPAQAQVIGQEGAFVLTPSATSLQVSVTPIEAPPPPEGGSIAGNVYRFSVADQAGTQLAITPCDGCISLVMRAPEGVGVASIQRYADGAWLEVVTLHAGMVALYQTNPTALGDYAVIALDEPAPGIDPAVLAGGAIALVLFLGVVFLLFRVKQAPEGPPAAGRGPRGPSGGLSSRPPTRIPSKKKPGRRPPSERSNS